MSDFTPADRAAARLLRGRIIRTLHRAPNLDQAVLHVTVCGGPRDAGYLEMKEFAAQLRYLEDASYLAHSEKTDPLEPIKTRNFWKLTRQGTDLFEGVLDADPGIEIPR